MDPIVFIHGYSAESKESSKEAITSIYGSMPKALREIYGGPNVFEIDLGRYISLEDGVTLDDISRALERALRQDFSHLLKGPFNVIIHSTGALVIRNWIRRFSAKPSPIKNLIYLAGANLGSGWAHIGKGQLAKWSRMVFQGGGERGVQVLDSLELGSSWTLDLHKYFLNAGSTLTDDYKIFEYVIIGSQADVSWFEIPIRYAKEDGSDGVVRVAASNVNFQYLRFGPSAKAMSMDWQEASRNMEKHMRRKGARENYYEIKEASRPGAKGREEVPFAIPYECAHSGDDMGVVTGSKPRAQVLSLIQKALAVKSKKQWSGLVSEFQKETDKTYALVLEKQAPSWWTKWISEPRAQYDKHAQLIFRIRDQDGRPVMNYDIFWDSDLGANDKALPIGKLFEDKHQNDVTPNVLAFYMRTDAFSSDSKSWEPQVPKVQGAFLEISAVEPETGEILYLPMRFEFTSSQLTQWIQGHRTTIVDVELLRLPSPNVFKLVGF